MKCSSQSHHPLWPETTQIPDWVWASEGPVDVSQPLQWKICKLHLNHQSSKEQIEHYVHERIHHFISKENEHFTVSRINAQHLPRLRHPLRYTYILYNTDTYVTSRTHLYIKHTYVTLYSKHTYVTLYIKHTYVTLYIKHILHSTFNKLNSHFTWYA